MFKRFKNLIAVTFALNFLIVIGGGHGIGCLGIMQLMAFPYFNKGLDFSLGVACVATLIGQLLMIFALFLESDKSYMRLIFAGLVLMGVGFIFLLGGGETTSLTFITAAPFLILSIVLIVKVSNSTEFE